jgi:hypothetical protein
VTRRLLGIKAKGMEPDTKKQTMDKTPPWNLEEDGIERVIGKVNYRVLIRHGFALGQFLITFFTVKWN